MEKVRISVRIPRHLRDRLRFMAACMNITNDSSMITANTLVNVAINNYITDFEDDFKKFESLLD
jgi:hypothetical protein